jgi:ABC-type transporter Mla subunit MlaD
VRTAATAALGLFAIVVVVMLATGGGDAGHKVSVVVPEATNVVPGQYVRSAGGKVGEVTKLTPVDGGRRARIEMRLQDSVWPLPAGTTMTLRWGGTVNYSNRYVDLHKGSGAGPAMARDGVFPTKSFTTPIEFDGLLRTFDKPLRNDVRAFLNTGGKTLQATRPALRRALDASPEAVQQAGFVLRDLDAERYTLRTLVRSADNVLGAVQRARPGLRSLLGGAAQTFDAIASQSASLQGSLQRAPRMLATTRSTLARADRTLDLASTVTRRIAPGVTQLRRVAAPLDDTLRTVVRVAPDAKATLRSLGAATPDLNPLLDRVTALSPQLESIGEQAVDNLDCIRPYTPSIMSFFSNWGDFFSLDDGKDKLIRAQVQNFLPAPTNAAVYDSAQAAKIFPGLKFGFPRPPGTNAGQPWFLPECGAGPDALDPDKDPEARPFKQVFKMPSLRSTILGEATK